MTQVVVKAIDAFISRSNVADDAIFYATNFICSLNFKIIVRKA